jgi:hypothetical protein
MAKKKYRNYNNKLLIYRFLNRFYQLCKETPDIFVFKKLKNCEGLCDYVEETLFIDYRKELLPIIIHETLHYFHPDWCESQILKNERLIINKVTTRQFKKILKMVVDYVI